jgi:hypothetical protein
MSGLEGGAKPTDGRLQVVAAPPPVHIANVEQNTRPLVNLFIGYLLCWGSLERWRVSLEINTRFVVANWWRKFFGVYSRCMEAAGGR